MKKTIIGLDLDEVNSQISYYNDRSGTVETVSRRASKEQYLIPTPEGLFRTAAETKDLGIYTLANFIRNCIELIQPQPEAEGIFMAVTMKEIGHPWIEMIRSACEMIGITRDRVVLMTYRESYFYYVLNQKRELWSHASALFDYSDGVITSYLMKIDHATKPALVSVIPGGAIELRDGDRYDENTWNEIRDRSFLELIKDTFQGENVSSTYLIGSQFDKSWSDESLRYLCRKRHVFQGRNLYTQGACYGMCSKKNIGKNLDLYLYKSEDLVDTNIGMKLEIRGQISNYLMINAGVNWFDAAHICEIILDDDQEIEFYSRSMLGGNTQTYTVSLDKLPPRPPRTTRLEIRSEFTEPGKCRIRIRDLGFGEFFPASSVTLETVLDVQ